jgi:hypothetical protein
MDNKLELPFVTPHFTQPENSVSIDFYQKIDLPEYAEEFVYCYHEVERGMSPEFGQFTMKTNLLAFTQCPGCGFPILTNRDVGQKITCKSCDHRFNVTPVSRDDLQRLIDEAESKLDKKRLPLADSQVILLLQNVDEAMATEIDRGARSSGFERVSEDLTPCRILAIDAIRRNHFQVGPFIAFRKNYGKDAGHCYKEETPPDVDRLVRQIRSQDPSVRSVSRVVPATLFGIDRALQEGRFEEVARILEGYLLTDSGNPLYLMYLVHALTRLGRHDEAKARGKLAASLHPDNADLQASVAVAYIAVGDYSDAIFYLERAVDLSPDVTEYSGLLRTCRQRLHNKHPPQIGDITK